MLSITIDDFLIKYANDFHVGPFVASFFHLPDFLPFYLPLVEILPFRIYISIRPDAMTMCFPIPEELGHLHVGVNTTHFLTMI